MVHRISVPNSGYHPVQETEKCPRMLMYYRRHPRLLYILLDNQDVRWFEEEDEEGYTLVKLLKLVVI